MRKMSFRVIGSDAALETRIRRKSKEIAMARFGYFVRTIVEDVSLRSRFPLFLSSFIYLTTFLQRDRKLRREEESIEN